VSRQYERQGFCGWNPKGSDDQACGPHTRGLLQDLPLVLARIRQLRQAREPGDRLQDRAEQALAMLQRERSERVAREPDTPRACPPRPTDRC